MSRFAFTGYYGMSNFGDDLFGAICLWGAARYWDQPAAQILATPGHDCASERFLVPRWWPVSWYRSPGWLGRICRVGFMARTISTHDVLVLGGGSTLSSSSSLRTRAMQARASRRGRVQLAAVGVSVGPFDGERDRGIANDFLRSLCFVALRDRASVERVRGLDPDLRPTAAADLAGLLPIAFPLDRAATNPTPTLGVAPCNMGAARALEAQRLNQRLAEALLSAPSCRETRVQIFVLNSHPFWGDREIAQDLLERLQQAGIDAALVPPGLSVEEIWRRIGGCTKFFSVRLHGAIAAYMADVPFALFEYHVKCSDFLDDIGQDPHLRLPAATDDPESILAVLQRLGAEPPAPCMSSTDYTLDAERNFTAAPWYTAGSMHGAG